ncbi:MAG: DUF6788 family protein, partial [Candidatus Aerophobetes bacterium]|nr:DUF6788 family protein [Candidatus Aerophobetes bacterium]
KALSDIRQEIVGLREDRKRLEDSLFRPKKMIRASLVFLPNYCGKKNCRCKKGFPHGPYPYLSERRKGRTRMTYVKKSDLYKIEAEAKGYARFQHKLARLTKINKKIRSLLEKIRVLNCREVDEYRKRGGK